MGDFNARWLFLLLLLLRLLGSLDLVRGQGETIEVAIIADVLDITERHQQRGNRSEDDLKKLFDRDLYFNALGGNSGLVREALENSADPNGINRNGFTPLHAAAFKGYYDIANLLLFYGADPNARANREETPLHFAAMHGNTAVVDLLLRHRARVGAADEDGRTPIWVAAFYGNAGALAALLANRERQQGGGRQQQANEVSSRSLRGGVSPLFAAAQEGHLEAVRLLVEAGANLDEDTNSLGQTPLFAASANGHHAVVRFLIRNSRDPKRLLERRDESGRTALFSAACAGHDGSVNALLDARANVDARNADGQTPLFCAARRNRTKTTAYLVTSGANVNAKDDNHMSPLYAASYYGHTLVARVLLMASKTTGGGRRRPQRTDVEAKSAEGFTPLLIAAQEGHLETVQVLVEDGRADLDATNNAGANALYWPAYFGRIDVLTYLMEKGANVLHLDELGRSVLWAAVAGNRTETATMLVNRGGVNVNLPSKDGWSPLHVAAYFGRQDMVRTLLDLGAETEARTSDGQTPLYIANRRGNSAAARALLSGGADASAGSVVSLGGQPLFVAGQVANAAVSGIFRKVAPASASASASASRSASPASPLRRRTSAAG